MRLIHATSKNMGMQRAARQYEAKILGICTLFPRHCIPTTAHHTLPVPNIEETKPSGLKCPLG